MKSVFFYVVVPVFVGCGSENSFHGKGESDTDRVVDSARDSSTAESGSDHADGTDNREDSADDSAVTVPPDTADGDSETDDTGIDDTQGQDVQTDVDRDSESGSSEIVDTGGESDSEEQQGGTDTGWSDTATNETAGDETEPCLCIAADNCCDGCMPIRLGQACDDADACTMGDVCGNGGECIGTSFDCVSPGGCETADGAVCNGDGTCAYPPVRDCLGGDGCCPAGCEAPEDTDCVSAWMKAYGGDGGYVSSARGVAFEDGHVVSASRTNGYGADGMDCIVVRTDRSGEVLWSKRMSSGIEGALDVCNQVITGDSGDVLVVGLRDNWTANDTSDRDGWAFLLNRDGEVVWQYIFYGGDGETIEGGTRTSDGDFVLVGTSRTYNQSEDLGIGAVVFKLRYDSGELLWLRNIASTRGGPFELLDVTETQDSDLILSGQSPPWGGDGANPIYARWFLRADSDVSEIKWQRTYRYRAGSTIGFRHLLHSSGDILGLAGVSVADPLSLIGEMWDQGAMFRLDGETGAIVWDLIFDYTLSGESTVFRSPVERPDGDVLVMGRIDSASPFVPLLVQVDFETGNTIVRTTERNTENWAYTQLGERFGDILYGFGDRAGDVFEETQALHFRMPFSALDALFSSEVDIESIPADFITENVNIDDGTKERFHVYTPELIPMPEDQLATVDVQDLPLTTTPLYP